MILLIVSFSVVGVGMISNGIRMRSRDRYDSPQDRNLSTVTFYYDINSSELLPGLLFEDFFLIADFSARIRH